MKIDLKLNEKKVFVFGLIIGAMAFLFIYGYKILDVTYDAWLVNDGGDTSQHYLGWLFYRKTPWTFPFGLVEGITYPDKFSITYMDSIPILAFVFKLFSPILPETFQYFGLYGLAVFMLQGGISAAIIYSLSQNAKASITGCIFFVFSTVLLQRMFVHSALACHPIILVAIYLYFNGCKLRSYHKDTICWTLLLAIASVVQVYFVPMVLLFMCGYYFFEFLSRNWYKAIIKVSISIATTLFVMYLMGDFYGSRNFEVGGLGEYNSNLNALLNDQGISFIDHLLNKNSSGRWEEFAYLGFGIILLSIITILHIIENRQWKSFKKEYISLVFIIIIFFILSIEPIVKIGDFTLFDISYPKQIESFLVLFRANGRFMWPIIYLIMLGSIVYTANNRKMGVYVIITMVLIQMIDLNQDIEAKRGEWKEIAAGGKEELSLQSSAWNKLNADEIYFFYNPVGTTNMLRATFLLGKYAVDHNMVMNDFYVSRKSDVEIDANRREEYSKLLIGNVDKRKMYIFSSLPVDLINTGRLHIYNIDGIVVGSASKIIGAREYTKGSNLDLINQPLLGILNGEITDQGRTLETTGISYGPYISLGVGTYHVEWVGDNLNDCMFDVCAGKGTNIIDVSNLRIGDERADLDFTIDHAYDDIEIRCINNGKGQALITHLYLQNQR